MNKFIFFLLQELLKIIRTAIQNFEILLRNNNLTSIQQLIFGIKYFKYKLWNNGSRGQVQIVKDNPESRNLDIYLKNSHETFGPNKNKLKVSGHTLHTYESIQNEFSIQFEKLQLDEKISIASYLIYQYNLTAFDKAIE